MYGADCCRRRSAPAEIVSLDGGDLTAPLTSRQTLVPILRVSAAISRHSPQSYSMYSESVCISTDCVWEDSQHQFSVRWVEIAIGRKEAHALHGALIRTDKVDEIFQESTRTSKADLE